MRFASPCALGLALGLVVSALSAPARAEVESELVKAGVQAFEDLEYAKAIDLLNRALTETLTREERIVTYKTLAFSHVALGHPDSAREAFVELLRIAPTFDLDRTISLRVRAVFEEARSKVAMSGEDVAGGEKLPQVMPTIEPRKPRAGRSVTFSLVYRAAAAQKLQLFYRQRGQPAFSRGIADIKDGRFELVVPGSEVATPGLEYYLVLLDEAGAPVAGAGSLVEPRLLAVQEPSKPVYRRPWVWGLIGGILAAGAIAGGVAAGVSANRPATLIIEPH